jgi:hypothetical protein
MLGESCRGCLSLEFRSRGDAGGGLPRADRPGPALDPAGDFPLSLCPRYANAGRVDCSTPLDSPTLPAPIGNLYMRVGEARLLWFEARVGVYRTDRLEELVSDVTLKRLARTGIFEAGDGRTGTRSAPR